MLVLVSQVGRSSSEAPGCSPPMPGQSQASKSAVGPPAGLSHLANPGNRLEG